MTDPISFPPEEVEGSLHEGIRRVAARGSALTDRLDGEADAPAAGRPPRLRIDELDLRERVASPLTPVRSEDPALRDLFEVVPGDHHTCVPRHVRVFARRLEARLRRLDEAPTSAALSARMAPPGFDGRLTRTPTNRKGIHHGVPVPESR